MQIIFCFHSFPVSAWFYKNETLEINTMDQNQHYFVIFYDCVFCSICRAHLLSVAFKKILKKLFSGVNLRYPDIHLCL